MKSRLFGFAVLFGVLFVFHSTSDVYAYPWFARRLVDSCNKCHVSFPKTNDYGWYVKSTGYELPKMDYTGLEESPVKRFFRYFPVAVRFKVDAINSNPSHMEGDVNIRTAQLISGGSIWGNRISWWFHKHMIENNEFEKLFGGTPHEMWGQYNLHFGRSNVNRLSLRYGMSEMPLRFSPAKTKLSEMEYAIYNAMPGENSIMLSMPQYGITLKALRLGGDNYNEVRTTFDLAFVNGTGDFSSSKFNQVFGRIGTSLANTMVGAFTYVGSQNLAMAVHDHADEVATGPDGGRADALMTVDNNFFRIGLDFDSNISTLFNVYGLVLYGRDSNPLALQTAAIGRYYGGFLGVDYVPSEKVMFSWRFDAVRFNDLPAAGHDEHAGGEMDMHSVAGGHGHMHGEMVTSNTDAMVFGTQFLPLPNIYQVRLTAEYRLAMRGQSDKLIAGVQFAF
ncbi:MAG: hypothetical protein ACE5HO_10385 [bacterium]